jgi:signal transduction histidine kinase
MDDTGTRQERIRQLTQVSRAFTYAASLKDILRIAADQAAEMLDAERAILMLADADGLLRVRAAYGVPPEIVERFRESFDESLVSRLKGLFDGASPAGFIGVPLVVQGRVTGLLAVMREDGAPPSAADEWLLSALADQTAAPLEHARLAEEIEDARRVADAARLYEAARNALSEAEAARLEAERSRAQAEAANRAKSDFIAHMSHDLRTPLNAIAGYVELIELGLRGPVTDAQREDLRRIRSSQRVLQTLVNNVLSFATLEVGRMDFVVGEVAVDETLAGLEPMIAPQLLAKRMRYVYRPCDPTLAAFADRDKLQQIVLNLLSNAIKFTPAGGTVSVGCLASGDRVSISVSDTGRGIPADKLERIFEPFVRVDTGFAGATEGTGLGLAISRDLARAMNGELTVESQVGEGSRFTLALPRVLSRPAEQ